MVKDIKTFSKNFGYSFKDPDLLEEAFRHSSYVNELGDSHMKDNERLEFLGDAVLDLVISDILMELFKSAREGDLSKYRAAVVNENSLCLVAKKLHLGDYLLLGRGETLTNGKEKPSILANTLEALLGALYLDAGYDKANILIGKLFEPIIKNIDANHLISDYKSRLQEYTQEIYKIRPEYTMIKETGPAHDKTFRIAIQLHDQTISEGEGKTKKEAEQMAAREAYLCLKDNKKDL